MKPQRTRRARRLLIGLVVIGAATAAVVVVRHDESTPVATTSIYKTTTITSGTLSTNESIDGSIELSTTLDVLHRIEGQTSSADTSPSSASASTSAGPTGGIGQSAPSLRGRAIDASIVAAAMDAATCATDASTEPTVPDSTTSTTTIPPTTTTVACDSPDTTLPAAPDATTTTEPTDGGTASSVPSEPTTTTVGTRASPQGGGGAARPSGAGGGAGGAGGGASSGGTGAVAATTRITQTVTSVISAGSAVALGDVLYTVDSQPVVALSGNLPAWRTLSTSSDDGPDIQQLEASLVSLGYDPDGDVVIDEEFDSDTKAMVERWQAGLGLDPTGVVDLGSVVFLPEPTTVASVTAHVGDDVGDGDTIVTLAAATQEVVIDVPDGDEAFITPGLSVSLGGGGATGSVSLLRSTEHDGAVVVQAVITPDAPLKDGASNGSTVKVGVSVDNVDDVLIVPAEALLSRLDGSYAVQVEADDGSISWHTVELLAVSGNQVGVRGDGLADGMSVLQPI